jgi:hypothetical protein
MSTSILMWDYLAESGSVNTFQEYNLKAKKKCVKRQLTGHRKILRPLFKTLERARCGSSLL